jgi:hypothetical protein
MLRYGRIDPSNSISNGPKDYSDSYHHDTISDVKHRQCHDRFRQDGFISMPFRPTDVPGGSILLVPFSIFGTGRRVSGNKAFQLFHQCSESSIWLGLLWIGSCGIILWPPQELDDIVTSDNFWRTVSVPILSSFVLHGVCAMLC